MLHRTHYWHHSDKDRMIRGHERTQRLFTGSTIPRRDVFSAGSQSDLIPFNMSRSSKVRKFSCSVQRAPKKTTRTQGLSHFESTLWRYAGLVAGIHCRGEDLAFFPSRRIFSTTNVYICSENAAQIGGFYFMWLKLATSERRVPDFIVLFMFTGVGECKVNEPTTVR